MIVLLLVRVVMPIAPYIGAQLVAALYAIAAWRWPRPARVIAGIGFLVAGGFNIWTALHSPSLYVEAFGPQAFPIYRTFIYAVFARHTALFVIAIALGQLAVGAAVFAHRRWRKLGYLGAIAFLVAITPLGIGAAAPSTLIFAIGMALLLRSDGKRPAVDAEDRTPGVSGTAV